MVLRLLFLSLLMISAANAETLEQYWAQLFANKEAVWGNQVVSLAKALDDEKAKTAALQKQLDEGKCH